MYNIIRSKIYNLFISNNKYELPYLLPILVFLIYFSILSTLIGTFVLNLSLVLFGVFFLIFFVKNKKKIEISLNFKIIFTVITILILNILFSEHPLYSAKSFMGLIKNIIFLIGCYVVFKIESKIFEKFIKFVFIIFLFTAFDTILQYLTGKDIFGYPQSELHYGRLSGPFGEELIVGSYLSKLIFISIFFFFINLKKNFYDLIFLIFGLIVLFITKERSAFLMTFFTSLVYIFFRIEKLRFKIILSFIFISLIVLLTFTVPDTIKRYKFLYNSGNNILHTQWGAHFLTSYEIFKKNPILGTGIRTFRHECSKDYLKNIQSKAVDIRCSTHPHNFYFEILAETGSIGLFIFLSFLFTVFKKIINTYKKNTSNNNIIISISIFFMFFWPIKTTGSIFSSWNSYFYILALIIIFYQINFLNFKNK